MTYRELNSRTAVRCDVCGAADGTVRECWWPYSAAAAERFDRKRDTSDGSGPGGQFYDVCGPCRQVAAKIRQQFTDSRGVRVILLEYRGSGTENRESGGLAPSRRKSVVSHSR